MSLADVDADFPRGIRLCEKAERVCPARLDVEFRVMKLDVPRLGAGLCDADSHRGDGVPGFVPSVVRRRTECLLDKIIRDDSDASIGLRVAVLFERPRRVLLVEVTINQLRAEWFCSSAPRLARSFVAAVLFQNPCGPQRLQLLAIRVGEVVHLPGPPLEAEGVFVVDLHERDGGFVGVALAGVGVHVREEVAGVVLLHGDHRGAVVVHALVVVGVALFLGARTVGVGAGDVQVQVGVDAVFLQLGDEEIEPVELAGVERAAVLCEDAAGRAEHVHVVKAHAVDAKFRHACGDLRSHGFVWKICSEARVHTEDAQALFAGEKVAVLHMDESIAARGLVVQPRNVCRRFARVVPRELEGEHFRLLRSVRSSSEGEEREEAQGFHSGSLAGAGREDKRGDGKKVLSAQCSVAGQFESEN